MTFGWHKIFEKNSLVMLVGIVLMISVGGLIQIIPLFRAETTIEKVHGVRPYTPLELAGFNVYLKEGCYGCHSQQIRPLRDEVERYGHYSLAAESMFDHPFQWGSKRTGPDLARVGGKYSDEWHVAHMTKPQRLVPESIMPPYPHLSRKLVDMSDLAAHMKALKAVGVPYTEEQIANAEADVVAQATNDADGLDALLARYGDRVNARNFDSTGLITEMDALIAYMQVLGTLADLRGYEPEFKPRVIGTTAKAPKPKAEEGADETPVEGEAP